MKKIIVALVMFVGISSVNAQSFGEGTSVIQAGVGFGGTYGTPISLGYEYGITEKIGVGLSVGYASKTEAFGFGTEYKFTNILVGLKGNYHFYTTDVIDLYGGAILGYNVQSATSSNSAFPANAASATIFGAQAGGRYYFTESFGAFAEVGFGLANVNIGLAYKL